MKCLLALLALFLITLDCQKEKIDLIGYQEIWVLSEINFNNQGWEMVEKTEKLNLFFKTDSTLFVETDSLSCDGTYGISLVNNGAYPKSYKVFAPCITPADHMWWTFQASNPDMGYIQVLPRLNPTAYLLNMEFKFRVEKD
ncbi:hypothetical protein [Jiulongibacter sediminis]|jgi:hypothetical protein|uniref:hypothetical protein n=1 Tax=Jiulongibacter sediminis TaxID=1605367 RepID=UPI0026EA0624|nr:hypothetical protein [Jiulongibacter sediminis]